MRVKESMEELRRICQASDNTRVFLMGWRTRKVERKISIYITRLLLEMHFSANQATLIELILGILSGLFLTFPDPGYWLIGIVLWEGSHLFDYSDGEIARYNKSSSIGGAFRDDVTGWFNQLWWPICISFGLYQALGSIFPLMLGFLAVLSLATSIWVSMRPYFILHEKGLLAEAAAAYKLSDVLAEERSSGITKYWSLFLFVLLNSLFALMIISIIIDYFIPPFTIGSVAFNARYFCFMIFNLAWLLDAIKRIYLQLHNGVRLRP